MFYILQKQKHWREVIKYIRKEKRGTNKKKERTESKSSKIELTMGKIYPQIFTLSSNLNMVNLTQFPPSLLTGLSLQTLLS